MTTEVNHEWPAWRYGPKGESAVCANADEVPEGWASHPSAFDEKAPKAPPREALPLTRKQIIADLSERKLQFDATAPTVALYEQLVAAIEATA